MIHGSGRTMRLIAGGTLGLTVLALAPNTAGAAISTTAFCQNVPTGQSGFTDIAQAGVHTRNVECLKGAGVTAGTTATTYSPTANVTRGQMATFIANMLDRAVALDAPGAPTVPALPTAGASADAFTDDETSVHENNINRLKQAGIISGTTATTFEPSASVSRAQMASFIAQALAFARGSALVEGADAFTDDETSVHEANINRLATADIVDGTGPGTYNPSGLVSRAQMASFIVQAMADLHQDGFITALPPSGQQTFTLPQTRETRQVTNVMVPTAAMLRTCTVSGLTSGATVDAVLVPTDDVTAGLAFADTDGDNVYDEGGTSGGYIANVNGANVAAGDRVNDIVVSPVGAITVTFGSSSTEEIKLVVVQDAGTDDDEIDLIVPGTSNTNPKLSAEPFGVGCPTLFIPAEGPIGQINGGFEFDSDDVDRDLDLLVTDETSPDQTFFWDSNDVFQFQGVTITQAQFEGILSEDPCSDELLGSYNPDPAGVSTFNIVGDSVCAPDSVTASVLNADGGATINDLRVIVDPEEGQGPGTVYDLYFDADNDTTPEAGELLAGNQTLTLAADGTQTFTFNNAPNGTGNVIVVAKNPVSGEFDSTSVGPFTIPAAADTTAPISTDAEITTSGGFANRIDAGDVLKACFNEALAAPGAGDAVELTDTDGNIATLTAGGNATFALGAAVTADVGDADDGLPESCAANQTLVITVTGTVTVTNPATGDGLLNPPVTATDASSVTDVAGNNWDLVGSNDDVFDLNAGDDAD